MVKKVVVLCDGMADYPVPELGGRTPMEVAKKPNMDFFASKGEVGTIKTVPDSLAPGSDVANLAVMGYDPARYYTGRSPLEAVSMGVELSESDVAMRCNLVTLSDEAAYEDKTMVDYCAGDISTEEATELIKAIGDALGTAEFSFHPGFSYRHCLVWHAGTTEIGTLTPPHDISGKIVGSHLDTHPAAQRLIELMKKSYAVLSEHPINKKRIAEGKRPANSIWLWGQGKKPALDSFEALYGVSGAVVSAVDLIKGIGECAGMKVCAVDGATGYIDTNFEGKTKAALDALEQGCELVYLHFEAPDECGHRHEVENKVHSIELIDSIVLGTLRRELEKYESYRLLILPDHPTPLVTKTHARDAVPYVLYDRQAEEESGVSTLTEHAAAETGVYVEQGYRLMGRFIGTSAE